MTGTARINKAAVSGVAVVLALMLGAATGASAQCVGSYHASSGLGATHSATVSSGVHTTGSTHSGSTPSACATTGGTANAAHLAALHPAGVGVGAGKTGAVSEHRTKSAAAVVNKNAAVVKKVKP
jgi:hypothetical protein